MSWFQPTSVKHPRMIWGDFEPQRIRRFQMRVWPGYWLTAFGRIIRFIGVRCVETPNEKRSATAEGRRGCCAVGLPGAADVTDRSCSLHVLVRLSFHWGFLGSAIRGSSAGNHRNAGNESREANA